MLVLDIEAADPSERTLIKFFARAHSVDAALEGWRLALWCLRPPAALAAVSTEHGHGDIPAGMVAFCWPDADEGTGGKSKKPKRTRKGDVKKKGGGKKARSAVLVPVATVLAHPALIEAGQRVVLARRELPAKVFELLSEKLHYEPDLETQLPGWWYGLDDELPDREPPWRPTGALVPGPAAEPAAGTEGGDDCDNGSVGPPDLRDGVRCLVMVEVDDCWLVLSEHGLRTYAFGERLADGEGVRFVRSTGHGLEVWKATHAGFLDANAIEECFGADAAERARKDAPAVLVTVTREPRDEPAP